MLTKNYREKKKKVTISGRKENYRRALMRRHFTESNGSGSGEILTTSEEERDRGYFTTESDTFHDL